MPSKRSKTISTAPRANPSFPALLVATLLLSTVAIGTQTPVLAATITVDGICTLVDAMSAANSDTPVGACVSGELGLDTIVLTQDVLLLEIDNETNGPNGLPFVASAIRIEGNGFEIKRENGVEEFRLFAIGNNGDLTLADTTLRNGRVPAGQDGGTMRLLEGSQAQLLDVVINGGFARDGGAIRSTGSLKIFGGQISNSDATRHGGALIVENGQTLLLNSTITDNTAMRSGGGVRLAFGELDVVESSVTNNRALTNLGYAGGLSTDEGTLRIDRSFIGYNSTEDNSFALGGGIASLERAVTTVTNSTLSNNEAREGAAIYSDGYPYFGEITLTNVTVAGNEAFRANEAAIEMGGSFYQRVIIDDTIVGYTEGAGRNCKGDVLSDSTNFSDDTSCQDYEDLTALSLLPGDNGGSTLTHALFPGSSAIDSNPDCDLDRDQRGYGRTDGACDAGSFEVDGVPPPTLTTSGDCPGLVTLEIIGALPNSEVAIIRGQKIGITPIPGGPCEGSDVLIENPTLQTTLTADAAGSITLTAPLEDPACRLLLQAVELTNCLSTQVTRIP